MSAKPPAFARGACPPLIRKELLLFNSGVTMRIRGLLFFALGAIKRPRSLVFEDSAMDCTRDSKVDMLTVRNRHIIKRTAWTISGVQWQPSVIEQRARSSVIRASFLLPGSWLPNF